MRRNVLVARAEVEAPRADLKLDSEALDEAFDELCVAAQPSKETADQTQKAGTKLSKTQFNLAQQLKARQGFEEASQENNRKAEAIFTHYTALEQLLAVIRQAEAKGVPQEDIAKKLGQAFKEGRTSVEVVDLDLKKRKLTLELK